MPTLDGNDAGAGPASGLLATHFGGKAPLSERFRRARLRAQMFGDAGETLMVGRYTITAQVGCGAMGTVYRATDASLDREVAVKVLHRSDETHRARITIEAKALAKLSHPNVVTVHEVGTEDEQLFVAMEFVEGKTMQAWLEDPTGMPVLDAFAQAADGLHAAHVAGIVHRDFKPENVIIGDDGRVRVLDFGMARTPGMPLLQEVDLDSEGILASEPVITRTGILAGTPGYMAPEQFEGSRVDARADQFALCIALHEAIWGARPFDGEDVATLATSVLGGQAKLFEGSPREGLGAHEVEAAKAVIERGLQTRPEDRFDSMREVSERLRGTPEVAERGRPRRSRRLFALTMATSLGAGLLMLFLTGQPPAEPAGDDVPTPATVNASDEAAARLGQVPGALPPVSRIPGIHMSRTTLRFESMQLARVVGGEIEASQKKGHLVLPLYDHLSESAMREGADEASLRRLAVFADASTPFSELVDVLYTSGKAGFGAYELVVQTGAGTQGALRLSPPSFPEAPGRRPALKVMVLPEGFHVPGRPDGELIPRLAGKRGLEAYDFAALAREAAEHREEHSSIRAVVSASDPIRHDVLMRTLATLRGEACTTDPSACLMTHLGIEAGTGG